MSKGSFRNPALLIIDVQKAIDDPKWARRGERNNPDAERNIARLLEAWRSRHLPIFHIRHDSREPHSPYRPGQPGHDFKPEAMPQPGETVIPKQTNSAFIGTDLEARLRAAGDTALVICGVLPIIQSRPLCEWPGTSALRRTWWTTPAARLPSSIGTADCAAPTQCTRCRWRTWMGNTARC